MAASPSPSGPPADDSIDALFLRCRERLLKRIRWMMGQSARRIAESGDYMGALYVRIKQEAARMPIKDETHLLRLATRIARQQIIDQVRRPRVQRFDSVGSALDQRGVGTSRPSPGSVVDAHDAGIRVLEALEDLPAEYQTVIELRDFEHLSFAAIGERMGRTENATQILHKRALTRLGSKLRDKPAR